MLRCDYTNLHFLSLTYISDIPQFIGVTLQSSRGSFESGRLFLVLKVDCPSLNIP